MLYGTLASQERSKTMKIGIFGGSFNPPHEMHERIALYLKENQYVDKVIFVPTGQKYSYKSNLVSDHHRLHMLKLMCEDYPFMEISDYELKGKMVYTYETLNHFKKKYPHDDIYFICGLDNLSYIDTWKNASDILTNYKILVVDRKTHKREDVLKHVKDYKENIEMVHLKTDAISSTKIREDILKNNKIECGLNPKVIKYIKDNHVYDYKGE